MDLVPSLHDYRGNEIIASFTVVSVLAYLAVLLRFISRKISHAKYDIDDYLILVALVYTSFKTSF